MNRRTILTGAEDEYPPEDMEQLGTCPTAARVMSETASLKPLLAHFETCADCAHSLVLASKPVDEPVPGQPRRRELLFAGPAAPRVAGLSWCRGGSTRQARPLQEWPSAKAGWGAW
jgi:hypothetical protein